MENVPLRSMTPEEEDLLQNFVDAMPGAFTSYPTMVSLTEEEEDIIEEYAVDLQIPFDDLLRILVSSALRRHFDLIVDHPAPEVSGNE